MFHPDTGVALWGTGQEQEEIFDMGDMGLRAPISRFRQLISAYCWDVEEFPDECWDMFISLGGGGCSGGGGRNSAQLTMACLGWVICFRGFFPFFNKKPFSSVVWLPLSLVGLCMASAWSTGTPKNKSTKNFNRTASHRKHLNFSLQK